MTKAKLKLLKFKRIVVLYLSCMLRFILDDTTINYIVIAIKMTGALTRRKPASADIFVMHYVLVRLG